MRAIQIQGFGGPDKLVVIETPVPKPGPGQVLVKICAAGVNFADTLLRQDRYAVTPPLPCVLGSEATGIIEAIGTAVDDLIVGARVAAPLFAGSGVGGYADYATIDSHLVAPLPDALSFEVATALMVQGLTALHLVRQAPPEGKTVLVNAAAGGVGSLLIQLAKRTGAKTIVAAASSHQKLAFAKSLGADLGINYTRTDWPKTLREALGAEGPDIIYESVGGPVTSASLQLLAPLGKIVIYGALNIQSFQLGVPELLGMIHKNQSVTGFAFQPLLTPETLRADLVELFDLAVRGILKVNIAERYPLERAFDAHRALESRATMGKVVLIP